MRIRALIAGIALGCGTVPAIGVASSTDSPDAAVLERGSGSFTFSEWSGPPIRVWTHLPDEVNADTPIVIVMHGRGRDGDRYRDEWKGHSRRLGFILIVPEFDNRQFRGAGQYNHGGFRDRDGQLRPREQWAFSAIEPLFDAVKLRTGSNVPDYALYGHSAGAQFVHRFVLFMPEARIRVAVSANAGSYALPRQDIAYPYGLGGAPVSREQLADALSKPMLLLLGTADTDPAHPSLPQAPDAKAQGPHRLARGHNFLAEGARTAKSMNVRLGWRIAQALGIGHENGRMSDYAAPIVAGRNQADDSTLEE